VFVADADVDVDVGEWLTASSGSRGVDLLLIAFAGPASGQPCRRPSWSACVALSTSRNPPERAAAPAQRAYPSVGTSDALIPAVTPTGARQNAETRLSVRTPEYVRAVANRGGRVQYPAHTRRNDLAEPRYQRAPDGTQDLWRGVSCLGRGSIRLPCDVGSPAAQTIPPAPPSRSRASSVYCALQQRISAMSLPVQQSRFIAGWMSFRLPASCSMRIGW